MIATVLFLSFAAKSGQVTVDKLTLEAPRLSLSGSGNVDLVARTLDASGSVLMPGSASLPVRLEGDLAAPRYSLAGEDARRPLSSKDLDLDLPRQLRDLLGRQH